MTDRVTDIFAFACRDAHWHELLGEGATIPTDVLAEVDREAFEAATEHVRHAIVALLRCCVDLFKASAPKNDVRFRALLTKQFRPTTVAKTWGADLPLGTRGGHRLLLSVDEDYDEVNPTLRLYGRILGPAEEIERFTQDVVFNPPHLVLDDYGVIFGHVEIREGEPFASLARQLFEAGNPLMCSYVDHIETRRGRRSATRGDADGG